MPGDHNMSDNPVCWLDPLFFDLDEQHLELDHSCLRVVQLSLTRFHLACRLPSSLALALRSRRQHPNSPLHEIHGTVKGTDLSLDSLDEVLESHRAREDNVPARPAFIGVVRIALISSRKRTYFCKCSHHCLRRLRKDVAGRDAIEVVASLEIEFQCALHVKGLEASDGKAE